MPCAIVDFVPKFSAQKSFKEKKEIPNFTDLTQNCSEDKLYGYKAIAQLKRCCEQTNQGGRKSAIISREALGIPS